MPVIKIYHKDWIDNIFLNEENNIVERISDNKDKGSYKISDRFLLIIWEKWGNEYFFNKYDNNLEYYQITDQYIFDLYNFISYIYIISNDNKLNIYLLDINNRNLYYKNNLKLYANIVENTINKLYLDNNIICIYYDYKYYENEYFNTLYSIIMIDNIEYLLVNNSTIFYKDYNKYNSGNYIRYKNKIKIILNKEEIIYISFDYYNYLKYSNEDLIIYTIKDEILISDLLFFINYNENIYDLIPIIEYYKYFNINCFILDNIKNLNNNKLLDDLDILYYNNWIELKSFIETYKNQTFFLQSDQVLEINKNFIFYDNLFNIINYNENNIKEDSIKKIWYELNKENLDKYEYLINKQDNSIPKIIHFIWIGNNVIPNEYIYYIQTWLKNYDDYLFCFWNDSNIPKLVNQKYYDNAKSFAMKADILRYELLYFFGGIYVDCDCISIKNLDNIIKDCDGFTGYESEDYIAIGLMGFKKYDLILFNLIIKLSYQINKLNSNNIPQLTGPIFFTQIWKKYCSEQHIAFPIDYFYSYTFEDKVMNKSYNNIQKNNYSIHMWGYSWASDYNNIKFNQLEDYYINSFYLDNIIKTDLNKIKYTELSHKLKNQLYFKNQYNNNIQKRKIVHIMGMFFTGGIERYLYYIDKYGSHDKYNYYILYIQNENKYESKFYNIQNINMISFDWNHTHLNNLLILLRPDLIIDHYSLYLNYNNEIYENINRKNIIYFVHSAICYNKDISTLKIDKCIHLYKETNKHISWNYIKNNYYVTLGTELNNYNIVPKDIDIQKKINISIIGRIAEEKIPILFLKKLCNLSNKIWDSVEINIYGEKDNIFNKDYIEIFEKIILKSKIKINDFVHPNLLNKIFKDTNLLLIPSIYETGSFTCIEAFSYGIPVIARNVYGMRYLIEDKKTGYLCNNDKEILDIIKNIKKDTIFKNNNYILEKSYHYNIIEKIKDLEIIINENAIPKNLVIITSVLNIINLPLSYFHTRSIFTLQERFKQTIKTINSLKRYIPDLEILFCECSDLEVELESELKEKVNYYYNFYSKEDIRNKVNSSYKGLGEANLLLEGLKHIDFLNYKNIFKISGRYYLNTNFDYNKFNNNYNIFTNWDDSNKSLCTIFYKINYFYLPLFKEQLLNSIAELEEGFSIEQVIFNYFSKYSIIYDKLNISGFLSTEGYLFTV